MVANAAYVVGKVSESVYKHFGWSRDAVVMLGQRRVGTPCCGLLIITTMTIILIVDHCPALHYEEG